MPTVTSISLENLINLGPLTTTYTAPASCATLANNVWLSTKGDTGFPFVPDCNTLTSTLGPCLPSGSAIDARYAAYSGSPSREFQINYFSPGIHCPSAWTTVGVAEKNSAGTLSSSGVFTSPPALVYNDAYVRYPRPVLFMSLLEPKETAVVCCPSGFTASQDVCISDMPTVKFSTGCAQVIPTVDYSFITTTITSPQTTATANIFTLTATSPVTESITTSFSPSETSNWVAVSILPMVTLVHQATDLPATNLLNTTSQTSQNSQTSQTQSDSSTFSRISVTPTAAASTQSNPSVRKLIGVFLLAWMATAFMSGVSVVSL
jgi:hypothetical protein